jgi:hypothetical protein
MQSARSRLREDAHAVGALCDATLHILPHEFDAVPLWQDLFLQRSVACGILRYNLVYECVNVLFSVSYQRAGSNKPNAARQLRDLLLHYLLGNDFEGKVNFACYVFNV